MTTGANARIALSDGRTMPQLGLGAYHPPGTDTVSVIRTALALGYEAVDSASIYGNEEAVGVALQGHDDVFLTSKVWNEDQGYDETLRAFDASAKRLRRPTLDLYLVHWPAPQRKRYVESWKALLQLKREGRVRSIGVSNFRIEHLQRIIGESGETPVINQIELHPRFQQRELRAFHAQHSIATECWSPLGQGQLLSDQAVSRIAKLRRKSPAQVVIRWHLQSGLIVIPKSVRPEGLRENLEVFDFSLDADDMAEIGALDMANGRVGPDPDSAAYQ